MKCLCKQLEWWVLAALMTALPRLGHAQETQALRLAWEPNWLTIHGEHLPAGEIKIHYLEAYCRGGSTNANWVRHTLVGHETKLVAASEDGSQLQLECRVKDGLVVRHHIRVVEDGVAFQIQVTNPTDRVNEAQWAQPCVRLGDFAGAEIEEPPGKEIKHSRAFIFLNGKLTTLPTNPWATEARYTPGQVWRPRHVPAWDVNPRPLRPLIPDNGLIGCFSKDDRWIFAVAFEPYQELFLGVARCLHSDFRIGVLPPGTSREIRGKIYLVPNDTDALMRRYARDFPEHHAGG